jgi:epoxyqueuosine reductase QueG
MMGVHRNVIHPKFGNFILLGTILLDAEVSETSRPIDYNPCLECKLCVAACPVGAISSGGDFNFSACYTHNYREFSRCPTCGSSQRTKYENPKRVDFPGSGLDCVAIVYRTCRCVDCGQARRDQEKVYAPAQLNLPEIPPPEETLSKAALRVM